MDVDRHDQLAGALAGVGTARAAVQQLATIRFHPNPEYSNSKQPRLIISVLAQPGYGKTWWTSDEKI